MMPMEKLVKQCDMELMKMAMLKHEETFRQQVLVHDLHRLYRIQKQLMRDMTKPSAEPRCRGQRRRQPRRELKLQLRGSEATPPSRADELELTLAVGGGSRRKRRQSTPFASDCSGGSLTLSSSTDSDAGAPSHPQRATAFDDLQEGVTAAVARAVPQPSDGFIDLRHETTRSRARCSSLVLL